jgi:hypothetical protein
MSLQRGQRVILKRNPLSGRGVVDREDRRGRLYVMFDSPLQLNRWLHPDSLMIETEARPS